MGFIMGETKSKDNGIAVGVVTNNAGKILIMERVRKERGSDGSTLSWVFPGGKLNGSETFEEAVVREVLLETGFKVKTKRQISERRHPQFNVPIKYFECELAEFTTKPIQEVHEVATTRWVEPQNLKDYFTTDIDPKVAEFLKISQ
jgi:mutator protein MutT